MLGVGISALDMGSAIAQILAMVKARQPQYVCVVGVHGVTEAQADPEFRHIVNHACLATPDGMPLVWVGRWLGHSTIDRVYGPDLMLELCRVSSARGLRHFFFGGREGVASILAARMKELYPGLEVVGTYTPPFRPLRPDEEVALQRRVEIARPDVFWVGLSTPKQERFMYAYYRRLKVPVMIGVGAAFDMNAGLLRRAPRWMQRSGLEWCYRLYQEPRRLWRRYLRNNPLFLGRIFLQLTGLRKYRMGLGPRQPSP